MILLSLSLGIFISYFFVFVNSLFISEIGTSQLPLAYIFSGLGGTLITWLFNIAEKKLGFSKASTLFCLFFALVMFVLWFLFVRNIHLHFLIFFSYAWFWVSINFTALVFWKLPSNIFDLSENKKYNSIISSGEVISAIVAYLSVPALLSFESFTRDKLLLISFFGILVFSIITFFLGKSIKNPVSKPQKKSSLQEQSLSHTLLREPYFQLIFLSVFLAVIIQLLIDFSLMEVSANQMSDPKELAQYFAFLFGGMRLLELILKTFVSKYLVKEYGVFLSLSSLIFALAFIAIIGLSSLVIGYFGMILIVASLSKVFERSLYRSVYAPTINVLYQAYPAAKRALTQNYADGFGKTIGQVMAALLIFGIATVDSFESRVFILLISVLIILVLWFIVSKKLIVHYRIELSTILKTLQSSRESSVTSEFGKMKIISNTIIPESDVASTLYNNPQKANLSVSEQTAAITWLLMLEAAQNYQNELQPRGLENQHGQASPDKMLEIVQTVITHIKAYQNNELLFILNNLSKLQEEDTRDSKLIPLFILLIHLSLIKKTKNFNFYHSSRKLRSIDFLYRALIQNLADSQYLQLSKQDYYYLLEERIQKYTYLLASHRDLSKSTPALSKLILSEAKATQYDILYSLNFNHDQQILNQLVQLLNQGNRSQELIALELLELVLEEQEKKWILPILREEQPENVLYNLEGEFPQALLGKEKRLVSILANTLMDIPSVIQSQALIELINAFPEQTYRQLVTTLAKNGKGLLQFSATKLNQEIHPSQEVEPVNHPKQYAELLTTEMDTYQESELTTTIPHSYWVNDMNTETGSEKPFDLVYKTLYHSVFPMERVQ